MAWVASQRENPAVDSSRAVADSIPVDAQLIHQRQVKIRESRALEPDVPPALEMTGAAAGEDAVAAAYADGRAMTHEIATDYALGDDP